MRIYKENVVDHEATSYRSLIISGKRPVSKLNGWVQLSKRIIKRNAHLNLFNVGLY